MRSCLLRRILIVYRRPLQLELPAASHAARIATIQSRTETPNSRSRQLQNKIKAHCHGLTEQRSRLAHVFGTDIDACLLLQTTHNVVAAPHNHRYDDAHLLLNQSNITCRSLIATKRPHGNDRRAAIHTALGIEDFMHGDFD